MPVGPMVHLTTVGGAFHGRLVAARLGVEGIVTELRGAVDGPYPSMGPVEVYVTSDQVGAAREVLLADAVDAAFDEIPTSDEAPVSGTSAGTGNRGSTVRSSAIRWWQSALAVAVLLAMAAVVVAHGA